MSTMKTVTDRLESARLLREDWLRKHHSLDSQWILIAILEEILDLRRELQPISISITSATLSSGTKTEGSQSPTGKPGGSQAPSIPVEQTGETE